MSIGNGEKPRPVVAVVSYSDRVPSKLAPIHEEAELRAACSVEGLDTILPGAEVVLVWNYKSGLLSRSWHLATDVKWVHVAAAGVDGPLFPGLVQSDAVMTNAAGVFDRPMAEWTLMMVLAYVKEMFDNVEYQRQRHWAYREVGVLEGQRALVVGAGGIGRDIAGVLGRMGMEIRGVARSRRDEDPDFGTVHPVADLDGLLPWADFVIAALPLTPNTRELFGAAQFARMKGTARFLNVGRGATVDETALIAALQDGQIAHAALDVFATEPLPSDSPLWGMSNVYVSPHMSGSGFEERLAAQFLENLRRYKEGRPLLNVVDKALGFVPYRG